MHGALVFKLVMVGGAHTFHLSLSVNIDNEQERSVLLGTGDGERDFDPVSHTSDTSYI